MPGTVIDNLVTAGFWSYIPKIYAMFVQGILLYQASVMYLFFKHRSVDDFVDIACLTCLCQPVGHTSVAGSGHWMGLDLGLLYLITIA